MMLSVAAIAFLAAATAALVKFPSGKGGIDRADWVSRLFRLASEADAAGEKAVAAAARALITSLVGDKGEV